MDDIRAPKEELTEAVDPPPGVPFFESDLPRHRRITSLRFDDAATHGLFIGLEGGEEVSLSPSLVQAIHAARIHFEDAAPSAYDPTGDELTHYVIAPTTRNVYQIVIGLNVANAESVWYLRLDGFNYRHALGAEAGLTAKENQPLFLSKLSDYCGTARRDVGFAALMRHEEPPVVESLRDFLDLVQTPEGHA